MNDNSGIPTKAVWRSRWPALFALLALGGLYAALPSSLLIGGSRWLLLVVISLLIVPVMITYYKGAYAVNQVLGYILNGVVTAAMIISLALLIMALPSHLEKPQDLYRLASCFSH